jgi:hypothetical protein
VSGEKTILFLPGLAAPRPDAPFLAALGKNHRVEIVLPGGDAGATLAKGAALVVAHGAAAPLGCRLALDHGALVETLTLSAPEAADDALLARLGEVKSPCLLLQASNAPAPLQAALAAYQQRLPHATRILLFGNASDLTNEPAWVRLVADFVDRGERFVVNLGGSP